jgi:hypothetical protein
MRTAITLGIHHGGEIVELLAAAPTPLDEQRRAFKALRAADSHERFERIEFWDSGAGCVLRHRFKSTAVDAVAPASTPPPVEVPLPEGESTPDPAPEVVPAAPDPTPDTAQADDGPDDVDGFQVRKPRKKKGT